MTKPEITFKAGAVRASVFRNTIQRDGQAIPLRKVVLEVRYRDKDGQWQGTNSLSLNDLPKAITALQQAYEYLLSEQPKTLDGIAPTDTPAETPADLPPVKAVEAPRYPKYLGTKHF
jgi:hypothetical protein